MNTSDMKSPSLDVLISTYGSDGIERVAVMPLPVVEGVRYVVSWQIPGFAEASPVPAQLCRDDIDVFPVDSTGLSRNRNNALRHAVAEYCLIADDDVEYTADRLRKVIDTLDRNPDVDLAAFMYDGQTDKAYPAGECDLTVLPKGFYISSIEIAFRRKRINDHGLWFNEKFGINAPVLGAGEDAMFLLDARRAGLRCRFFPVVVASHRGLTTGSRPVTSSAVTMADGAYIWKAYGVKGIPRLPLFVWRNYRRGRLPFFRGLRDIIRGYFYATGI